MVYSQILFLSSGGRASRREGLMVAVVSVDIVVMMEIFAVLSVSAEPGLSREMLRMVMVRPNAMP